MRVAASSTAELLVRSRPIATPSEFGIVDEMPIANSKQCTAMVALTAAPAKGLNQMPFANPIKCPIEVGVGAEV